MVKKKITFELSEAGIDKALKELEDYKKDIQQKTEVLRQKIANELKHEAQGRFDSSVVSEIVHGTSRNAEVTVTVENGDKVSVVIASGADAVWVEFGAGVYYNGSVGDSPHPKGKELGMTIGGYGKGNGRRKLWGYYDGENLVLSHGTQATMPMYRAMTTVCDEIGQIAEEVFK